MIQSIEWLHDKVRFLDQTKLPFEEDYIETSDIEILAKAIESLQVRGAPLIGIAAAYGVLLGTKPYLQSSYEKCIDAIDASVARLAKTRPTAKNLFWALERMQKSLRLYKGTSSHALFDTLEKEAISIHTEDREMCHSIGRYGAALIPDGSTILTHCNTGALATGGIGTALGVIATAFQSGKKIHVYADETRPLLQGSRLTMWELNALGIPSTLLTDNAAAWTIKNKKVNLIITGADRIAMNGDSANKIGTMNLAILAKEFGIPFYIAAPTSTFDSELHSGDEIPIEERGKHEVVNVGARQIAPATTDVFAPAFDVTPNRYITAIISEAGIHRPPFETALAKALKR